MYWALNYVLTAVMSGEYITNSEWKRRVQTPVQKYEVKNWQATCELYRSLSMVYKDISMFHVSPWWQLVHVDSTYFNRCRLIIQLLTGKGRVKRNVQHV